MLKTINDSTKTNRTDNDQWKNGLLTICQSALALGHQK